MLRFFLSRATSLAVFAALMVSSQTSNAQTFSVSPDEKLELKAAKGELTTESITFANNTDKPVVIRATYTSDASIGIDLPKDIALNPRESFDVIISYLGDDDNAKGLITLSEGNALKHIEISGNRTGDNGEEGTASVYDAGNQEIALSVGPNPIVSDLNVVVRNAATVNVIINDLAGKIIASSKSANFTWKAANLQDAGTYFVTVRGTTNSGKPFNETRKVVVN
jgi:hypothetical protein